MGGGGCISRLGLPGFSDSFRRITGTDVDGRRGAFFGGGGGGGGAVSPASLPRLVSAETHFTVRFGGKSENITLPLPEEAALGSGLTGLDTINLRSMVEKSMGCLMT